MGSHPESHQPKKVSRATTLAVALAVLAVACVTVRGATNGLSLVSDVALLTAGVVLLLATGVLLGIGMSKPKSHDE